MKELPKAYEPKNYEDAIYKKWEESGLFNPDNLDLPDDAPSYTIILPPPNITDKLHLGHSSMLAIEDLLIRFHRMKGYRALWVPGTDHAAIATQNVVEKKMFKEEGLTRHDLGREKFLEKVWEFLKFTQARILHQTRKMGASMDWSRAAFTLDEPRVRAVRKMFIDMYNAGVIYRGERIVNWCPRCKSTLADDEVEHKEQKGLFYTFKYDKNFPISIATTRPETKLGDVAVAVNPKDERYKKYVGQIFDVDFCGIPLKIKIIADRSVDMAFGTGALGVTPAHSMIDWQMAEANDLPIVKVIDEDGKIREGFGVFSGKPASEARAMIIKELKNRGLVEKEEEVDNNLSVCYRCDSTIEPLPSKQWFVSVDKKIESLGNKSLKEKSIEVAETKKIKFIPERFTKRYLDWMTNLHDWCISRQIWFGHRIPVFYKSHSTQHITHNKIDIKYFVHGTTTDNENGIATGWLEGDLSELGKKQAKELGAIIKEEKFDLIFCSDLKRAVDSAKLIFGGKVEIQPDKRLREANYGDFNGEKEDFKNKINDYIYKPFPNGESYENVEKRISDFLSETMDKYPGKKIAIVAHQAPQLALEVILNNKTWIEAIENDWRKKKAWLPGWNYELKELVFVGEEAPAGKGWVQDPDTLDTWFSSGMWTFSTLGWPDNFKNGKKSGDLARFHPTQVLETGYEIITLWVSRMIMMSLFAVGEIPFENVYLHGMVLDKHGKKMSKSKGNGIDPIDMIEKYGTDAVRLSLLIGSTPGNDVRVSEERIEGFRNMVNKLWNVSRFIIQLKGDKETEFPIGNSVSGALTLADKWIISKMKNLILETTADLENYNFSQAGERLRDFAWNDLADWYLEVSKFEKNPEKEIILSLILKDLLKLLHPFIPFVTEAIWSSFAPRGGATEDKDKLIIAKWPTVEKYEIEINNDFELIKEIVSAIRNARSENKIEPAKKIKAVIYAGDKLDLIKAQSAIIKGLKTGIEELEIKADGEKVENAIYAVAGGVEIYLIGAVDTEKEKARIEKEIVNLEKATKNLETKLANQEFIDRAPAEIVGKEKEKLENYKVELEKLREQMKNL
jgi:valyl-tRNA synthetase